MSLANAFRLAATCIAVTSVGDPVITRELTVAPPLSIVVIESRDAAAQTWGAAERLRTSLARGYDVSVRAHQLTTGASACPREGGCILISDGSVPARLTAGGTVIGAVRINVFSDRRVAIAGVISPPRVNLHGASSLDVQIHPEGHKDSSRVRVFDDGILVGESVEQGAVASVEWLPLFAGPRVLRIRASALDARDDTGADDEVDVGVEVRGDPAPVLMYEPEATWLGTFVRRALTTDRRFRVDARTRLGPAQTASRVGGGVLTGSVLAETNTVIVTAPDGLAASEVDLLEKFVRVRGGSVILLPDRRPTGPVSRLLPSITGERREAGPQTIGTLRASEIVTFDASREGVTVLESVNQQPVIVSRAMGRGRVVTSGALDAWRFRDSSAQFSRFWSSLVAASVDAAGGTLELSLNDSLVAPGETTGLTLEWRTLDQKPSIVTARSELRCDDGYRSPVRLWPGARSGVFTGHVHAMAAGTCTVSAFITHPSSLAASRALLVAEHSGTPFANPDALSASISAHGGVVVQEPEVETLVALTHERLPAARAPRETHPMRSPWWIAPFAACLGAEWWLRRRKGLK